jgi:cytochrome P450
MFKQILLKLSNNTKFLLHRLPYNEAFLREVMRKQTLNPLGVAHRATEDTELNGYIIPKVSCAINLCKALTIIRDALFNIQK